jgi:hypothetical protein
MWGTLCSSSAAVYSGPTCTASCTSLPLFPQTSAHLSPAPYSPPPGAQAAHERWSLVFFSRPGRSTPLRALTDQSAAIADVVARSPEPGQFETGQSAGEWFARRIKNQRIKNRTVGPFPGVGVVAGGIADVRSAQGPETWRASRGTEHSEQRAPAVAAN